MFQIFQNKTIKGEVYAIINKKIADAQVQLEKEVAQIDADTKSTIEKAKAEAEVKIETAKKESINSKSEALNALVKKVLGKLA